MRAILIYNSNSGGTGQVGPEEISKALEQAGFHPIYIATSSEDDLDPILAEPEGLVVCAGGDGTVRAVATRLVNKNARLAVVPIGTANNIARALGLTGNPLEIIAGLKDPVQMGYDLGWVTGPWGQDYFLEAFGYGLYADGLAAYVPEKGKSVLRSLSTIAQVLPGYQAHTPAVRVDGTPAPDACLLFEVLNTSAFGPRIKLAPLADPGDGWLDVVQVREENRDSLPRYVAGLLAEELIELPSVEARRARVIEIDWPGDFPFHVDGEVRPIDGSRSPDAEPVAGTRLSGEDSKTGASLRGTVRVEVLHHAVQFWLPRPAEPAVDLPQIRAEPAGNGPLNLPPTQLPL